MVSDEIELPASEAEKRRKKKHKNILGDVLIKFLISLGKVDQTFPRINNNNVPYMYAQYMRKNVRIQKASSARNVLLLQLNDFNKLPDLIGVQCVDW